MNIKRIVLTGGPCAGKTTAMAIISEKLTEIGWKVFIVPEGATHLLANGVSFSGVGAGFDYEFQSNLWQFQIAQEQAFFNLANYPMQNTDSVKGVLILLDRGLCDAAAYMSAADYHTMLVRKGTTEVESRDHRYDAVIHLQTAAKGAEKFYTTNNNVARRETAQEARNLDTKVLNAWIGHPHLRTIDNSTDFSGKMRRLLQAIYNIIGVPRPVEIERKYLVESTDVPDDIHCQVVEIFQSYLQDGSRIRRRGAGDSWVYTHTRKQKISNVERIEEERRITEAEYADLMQMRDPSCEEIHKNRCCFMWDGRYWELDEFISPSKLLLLEVELDSADEDVTTPPFIKVEREVTSDGRFSNHALAQLGYNNNPHYEGN